MKFFTIAWWSGADENEARDPASQYGAHLQRIIHKLPEPLQRFCTEETLHDSRLRRLELDVAAGTLTIDLDGYRATGNASGPTHAPAMISLFYSRVQSFESKIAPECVRGPVGYGDLGYDEVDLADEGFEHRTLFSTGIEFRIRFREFAYTVEAKVE